MLCSSLSINMKEMGELYEEMYFRGNNGSVILLLLFPFSGLTPKPVSNSPGVRIMILYYCT